jgi:hypothetical protein
MKNRLLYLFLLVGLSSLISAQSLCDLAITKVKVEEGYKLTAKGEGKDTISGLTWFNGSGEQSVLVNKNGEYCVKALFKNGCSDSECIKITDLNSVGCAAEISVVKFPTYALLCAVPRPAPKQIKWSTGDTSLCIKVEKPGLYSFNAVTANGCETKASYTYSIATPCKVEIVRSVTTDFPPSICAVSNVDIKKIKWSNGDTTKCIKIGDAKEYCVTIVGTNNCEAKACISAQPATCTASITKSLNGSNKAELCVISNQEVKSYKWSTGDTTKCILPSKSGEYCVTIVTKLGCEKKVCFTYVLPSEDCKVSIIKNQNGDRTELCAISSQNAALFSWSTGDSSKCIIPTRSGEYCVKIKTTTGCEAKTCIQYTIPSPSCKVEIAKSLDASGKATLCAIANQEVLKYRWSTGDTSKCISVTKSGEYCLTMVTKNGCETRTCYKYTSPQEDCKVSISADLILTPTPFLCAVTNQPAKLFKWNTGDTSKCLRITKSGEYCVSIVTASGCEAKSCMTYNLQNTQCKVEISKSIDPTGKVTLCAIANQDVAKYRWNTGDTTKCFNPSKSGEYCVSVLTKNGCETKACYKYTLPSDDCKVTIIRNPISTGFELCAISSQNATSFLWSTGDSTKCIKPTKSGEYCVKIKTANGCETKECIKIELPNSNSCKVNITATKTASGYKLCAIGSDTLTQTIQWSNGKNGSCIEVGPAGVYCVKVQFANGCSASSCITLTPPVTTNCKAEIVKTTSGTTTTFCVKIADTLKISKLLWTTGDTSTCIKPTRSGEYCAVIYTTSGCVVRACASYKAPNDTIGGSQVCNISIVKTKRSNQIYLCALTTGIANNAALVWSNGSKDKCLEIKKAGTYCVTIKTNSCEAKACYTIDSSEFRLFNNAELTSPGKTNESLNQNNEAIKSTKIGRYGPNPAMNLVNLEIESDLNQSGTITITDAYGKIHMTKKINLEEGQNIFDIETMNLNKGLYHINLVTAAGRKTIKIVKE